jgi:hypothetical protein
MQSRLTPLLLVLAACSGEVVEGSGVPEGSSSGGASSSSGVEPGSTSTVADVPTSSGSTDGASETTSPTEASSSSGGSGSSGGPVVCGDGVVEGDELCDDGDGEPSGCTGECVWTRSCLELLTLTPGLGDGTYDIDPEGDGSALKLYCDMAGGGWTQVSYEDFSGTPQWSTGSKTTCGALGDVLGGAGQFGKDAATERLVELLNVPHSELRAIADVVIIDSWDDEEILLEADGDELAAKDCREIDAETCGQTKNECGAGFRDGETTLSGTRPHATNSTLLRFSSDLDEAANNEAWGLNTLYVFVK